MTHRRSKIARLPREIHGQVNEFLDDSSEYQGIADWLDGHLHLHQPAPSCTNLRKKNSTDVTILPLHVDRIPPSLSGVPNGPGPAASKHPVQHPLQIAQTVAPCFASNFFRTTATPPLSRQGRPGAKAAGSD